MATTKARRPLRRSRPTSAAQVVVLPRHACFARCAPHPSARPKHRSSRAPLVRFLVRLASLPIASPRQPVNRHVVFPPSRRSPGVPPSSVRHRCHSARRVPAPARRCPPLRASSPAPTAVPCRSGSLQVVRAAKAAWQCTSRRLRLVLLAGHLYLHHTSFPHPRRRCSRRRVPISHRDARACNANRQLPLKKHVVCGRCGPKQHFKRRRRRSSKCRAPKRTWPPRRICVPHSAASASRLLCLVRRVALR